MINQMKCAVCGKEFGNGANCQNCGADRVTGLGNYNGYNISTNSSDYSSGYSQRNNSPYEVENTTSKTIICYNCGEVIPNDSKFCPYCSKELFVKCPKCGHIYSSQYPACNQCGTNRKKYHENIKNKKQRALEDQRKREEFEYFLKNLSDIAKGT